MKILVLTHELPPIGGGGGRAAYDICKELAARNNQVSILTSHMPGLEKKTTQDGIEIYRIPSLRKEAYRAPFSAMLAYIFVGFWAGFRLIKNNRPDIIHAHFAVPAGALAWLLSVFTGVPYVLTAHLGDVPGGVPEKTGKWFLWIKPFTYVIWMHARQVVAVSEYTRQLALKNYDVDIQVIPNGADLQSLRPLQIIVNQPPSLVFAGRFMPQKNPIAIVQILSGVKDLNWNCVLLGDGPLLDTVKLEISKYDMEDRFNLPGWVTPEKVLEVFSRSDILFMPSLSEGLPVVGVQALAKGLAVVASNIGGFLDLVDDEKNGLLVDVHDHKKFVEFLRTLLTDSEYLLCCRQASLQKALFFDIDQVSGKYQKLFEEILIGH